MTYTFLKRLGWNPRTILDVGAYVGDWTRSMKQHFPNALYTLIEPNPNPSLSTLSDTIIHEIVCDTPREVEWFSNGSTGDSIFQENTRHYTGIAPIRRNATTLDRLFPDTTFDFIKIDCQGAELSILEGGRNLVSNATALLLECSFAGEYNRNAPTFAEYIAAVDRLGFAPVDILELHHANEVLCQVDILFLRKTSPIWSNIQSTLVR